MIPGLEHGSDAGYLKRGAVVMSVSAAAGYFASYAYNIYLSHLLEAKDYGDYKVAFAFVTMVTSMVLLGGDRAAVRILPRFLGHHERAGVWEFLRFFALIALALSALVALGVFAVYLIFGIGGVTDGDGYHPVLFAVVLVPMMALGYLIAAVLQADRRMELARIPWLIGLPLLAATLVWVARATGATVTDLGAIGLVGGAALLIVAFQAGAVAHFGLAPMKRAPQHRDARKWLGFSLPMMGTFVLMIGMLEADIYMCEILAPEHAVGHFGAATTVAQISLTFQATITGLTAPMMAAVFDDESRIDLEAALSVQKVASRLLAGIGVPLFCVLAIWGRELLSLFGKDYLAAYATMVALAAGYLVSNVFALSQVWLQYAKRGRFVVSVLGVALAADVALNAALIPPLGILGSALSTAICLSAAYLLFAVVQFRSLGLSPLPLTALLARDR